MMKRTIKFSLIYFILLFLTAHVVLAQTTVFNFQGRLNDGANPANGAYDFQFKLFDAVTGGSQIGAPLDRPNLQLINGVFSTTLDFGAAFSGSRFLEISVRPAGSPNAYVVLGARQQILAVPLAIQATNSVNAINATNAQTAVNATNAQNSVNAQTAVTSQNSNALGNVPASGFARLNFDNTGGLRTDGNLQLTGNARQSSVAGGFVKAMLSVGGGSASTPPTIFRCYNGFTGNSIPPCGFTVTAASNLVGVYNIDFGTNISTRFASVSAEYAPAGSADNNVGVNYRFSNVDNQRIDVFTFLSGNSADTTRANFTIILY